MELRLSVCFFGLALMAGCSPQSASQSLVTGSAGENPWHLSREPLTDCKRVERIFDSVGLGTNQSQGSGFDGSPADVTLTSPVLVPGPGGAPQQVAQGPGGVVFPKAKAYMQAMFRHIVEADSRQAMPIFRGHFAPDKFCFSLEQGKSVDASATPDMGLVTFSTAALLLRDEVTHWQIMSHELAHILLGHQHLFNPTTFPVPKEADTRMLRLRQEFASLETKSEEAYERLSDEMPESLKKHLSELDAHSEGQSRLPFAQALIQAAKKEVEAEDARLPNPFSDQAPLARQGGYISLLLAVAPNRACSPSCKNHLLPLADDLMRANERRNTALFELYGEMRRYYGPEYLANGDESLADALGDFLLSRADFHPALTALSWAMELFAADVAERRFSPDQQRQKLSDMAQILASPTREQLAAAQESHYLTCLVLTHKKAPHQRGTGHHPPHCFRFQAAFNQARETGQGLPSALDDLYASLPKLKPSLAEVQEEIRSAYQKAGLALPSP